MFPIFSKIHFPISHRGEPVPGMEFSILIIVYLFTDSDFLFIILWLYYAEKYLS